MTRDRDTGTRLRPASTTASIAQYAPGRHGAPIDLDLASTVIPTTRPASGPSALQLEADAGAFRYPDASALQARLAAGIGVQSEQVLVTAGADEALERAFRAMLAPGDEVIVTSPTFEMLPRFARLIGATVVEIGWLDGALPVESIRAAASSRTRLIVIVSPNNPTGSMASESELCSLAEAVPGALLVVDLAYVEFASSDPTPRLLAQPRTVITRTFSKAWGLPGVRVGWAAGPAEVIEWMRRAGNPYSVAAPSLAMALRALDTDDGWQTGAVTAVKRYRRRLQELLRELGIDALESQANFVCIVDRRARWIHDGLAGTGIATRALSSPAGDLLRITCPADDDAWSRLEQGLRSVVTCEALLFDMDGVLADVSRSYRQAILCTAETFDVRLTPADVTEAKVKGNANDDWQLTTDLLAARGVVVPLDAVRRRFEWFYQGEPGRAGLNQRETLLIARGRLQALASRFALGIATGRPRADAERFLATHELTDLFRCCVTREDGPIKPDGFPVREAMRRLGVSRAWMIGDTPDDIRAARSAGAVPVGVRPPGEESSTFGQSLTGAGAAWVLPDMSTLEEILP